MLCYSITLNPKTPDPKLRLGLLKVIGLSQVLQQMEVLINTVLGPIVKVLEFRVSGSGPRVQG